MKAQKVVRVEIFEGEDGNTVVAVVFGVLGRKSVPAWSACGEGVWTREVFTDVHRIEMGWHDGYALRHFRDWTVPAPVVHPTESVVQAVEAACMAAAGWDAQDDDRCPSHLGGRRNRTNYANA